MSTFLEQNQNYLNFFKENKEQILYDNSLNQYIYIYVSLRKTKKPVILGL